MASSCSNRSLSVRIAISFAVFAVVGSVTLVWWMLERDQRESRQFFERLAETNARFVRDSGLPKSAKLAASLSEILKMRVAFRSNDQFVTAPEQAFDRATVTKVPPGLEVIASRIDSQWELVCARDAEDIGAKFLRRSTLIPLGLFWAGCLGLGLAISGNLIRPLKALSSRISTIRSEQDETIPIPALDRKDEIGHLARTFENTFRSLREERTRREQSEKLALLGRMATGLAHEIRNPVAAIRMHAQLIGDGDRDSRQMIIGESEKIENLVTQWMFLARPEPPQRTRQDIRLCLESALDALAPAARHAHVTIARHLATPVSGSIDARRMEQVFRNIAINAIHAMPDGGTLGVTAAVGVSGSATVTFHDEGKGFSEDALARHGEMFFSTKEGGMGIGLTVAEEITRAHGGELRVRNENGAVVEILLPA